MAPNPTARDRMIASAADLVSRRGPTASGFSDILAASGAPRGSVYHHFPGGKTELLVAMVQQVATTRAVEIADAGRSATSVPALIQAIGALFGGPAAESGWQAGCPVAAIASESGAQPAPLLSAAGNAFAQWTGATRQALIEAGLPPDRAALLAATLMATIQGGLLIARALGSRVPYHAAIAELARTAS